MELIQSAMRRSQSRESAKSEGTQSRHGHTPKDPTINLGEIDNYDPWEPKVAHALAPRIESLRENAPIAFTDLFTYRRK